jgi:hypothetical protein
MSVAVKLAGARRDEVASTVTEWLAEQPSPARLDAGAVLLDGVWTPRPGAAPVDPRHVEVLLDARDAVGRDDEAAEASALLALATAVRATEPGPVRERALAELRSAATRPQPHPGVRATLASFVR